jgi:hypothetical protein
MPAILPAGAFSGRSRLRENKKIPYIIGHKSFHNLAVFTLEISVTVILPDMPQQDAAIFAATADPFHRQANKVLTAGDSLPHNPVCHHFSPSFSPLSLPIEYPGSQPRG